MAAGRSWRRRHVSAATRCLRLLARPAARRLFLIAGVVVAGWLLGTAGQAHAETVPGARLPSVAADAGRHVAAVTRHVPSPRRGVVPAVRTAGSVLRSAHPPMIPAPPSAAGAAAAVRPGTHGVMAGSSRTSRHAGRGLRATAGGGLPVPAQPVTTHVGTRAATGASEKASARRMTRPRGSAPFFPRLPRRAPQRTQALLPPDGGGVDHGGLWRVPGLDTSPGRPRVSVPGLGTAAPAVRTAADEPSFSPD